MNKKTIFRHFLMLLVLLLCSARASAQEAYACYTVANTTLTFYYDTQRSSRAGRTYDMNTGVIMPGWHNDRTCDDVTKVVFAPSFADASPTSTCFWFYEMEKLESITDISFLNTANVTTMIYMFQGCKGLTSLDLSNFDTSKVTNMNGMFYGCSGLTSLDLSSFRTQNVIRMAEMFYDCYSLTSLYVYSFDTSKVTDMKDMFRGCRGLTSLDVRNFNTSKVTDMTYMFYGCSGLTSLYLGNFDTQNVIGMDGMFYGCSGLTSLDLGNFDTRNVDGMTGMFCGCSGLTSLVLSNKFNTSQVTSMKSMFLECSGLTSLNLSSFNTANVTRMDGMFYGCSSLTSLDVSNFDTSKVTNMNSMFNRCRKLTSLDLSNFNTSQVTDMSKMFYACNSLTSLDLSSFNTSKVADMNHMFWGCDRLTSLNVGSFNTSQVTDMGNMFSECSKLTSLDLGSFNTSKVTNMGSMFDDCYALTSLDVSSFNTSQVTNMAWMFHQCTKLTSLDLRNFNTSNVTNMDNMFAWCGALTSLDVSSFDTSKVTDMTEMFEYCDELTSLSLTNFDTSEVTVMREMFAYCKSLTELDLSSFITSRVTDMYRMFFECENLKTIYAGDGWNTDAVTSYDYMFYKCPKLVGGQGTTYDARHDDKSYAHIDGGPSNPGYFTAARTGYACYNPTAKLLAFYFDDNRSYHEGRGETTYDLNQGSAKPGWHTDGTCAKVTRVHFDPSFVNARPKSTYYWCADMANLDNITNSTYINTSAVKNMESMFQGCRKMTSLDLSHFNTSKVTTMAHMFDGCTQATVLNVSNFDTSNVTDMEGMFSYCNSLTSLDVSHFNTAKVTNMSKMFAFCCDLASLDVSNFNTANVTDMNEMFRVCLILESLDLSSFNTEKVTNMESMFNLCDQLRTIYIADTNDKWSTDAVTKSDFMFASCKNLVGGKGTTWNLSNPSDKTYARIDQSTLRPGYFTVKGTEAYAVYSMSSKTLTFRYDAQRRSYTTPSNVVYDVNMDADDPAWLFSEYVSIVTKVIFNPSFAAVRPTNTSRWFQGMALLTSITGMEYLNTSKVTKMDNMFRGCTELSGLDLSHFDTFYVKSMAGMFQGCSSVTELDLGNFNTRYFLVDTRYMFQDCLSLKTIKVDKFNWNTYDVTSSTEMFSGCNNLVGGQGTRYNASNPTDKTYSRIDGGTDNPGYLTNKNSEGWLYEAYAVYTEEGERTLTFYYDTQKNSRPGSKYNVEYHNWLGTASNLNRVVFDPSFADYRPTSTSEWFLNMSNLLSIEGIEYLNTSEVTDMSFMFNNCGGQYFLMKTLDLSHFNTAKVTNMQAMFANNSHLTTIIVGDGWTTDAVTNSPNMFYGCTQLVGDQGTAYNANYLDKTYARLDGGTGSPGYFSHFKEPYACYMAGNKSLTLYYDNQRSSRAGTTYDLNSGNNRPGWTEDYSVASGISTVVFDQSFATALPATTAYWFADMAGLRTITGWENLNTQFVTDMSYMFSNCGMPTLDLSSFDTSLTRDMSYMFYRCRAASIDLSSFNTSSVTTMEGMFSWCFNMTRLDLDNFKTTNVEVMTSMFENCPYLNTICVGTNWTTDGVTESDNMFNGCTRLVGGLGTAYSVSNPRDKTYAHLDGGPSDPGYFSRFQAYAVYTPANTTLTFYHDSKRDSRTGTTYDMNKGSNAPGWGAVNSSVTKVVFDSSFADYCPTTTRSWFSGMTNLQTITDMSNLNTSEVTNMQAMFNLCSSLTRLDLRGFNTAKVTSMGMMFNGCSSLQTIYVGEGWNTAAVTSSNYMFRSCSSLVGGKGTTYDANHVDKTYAHIDGGTSNPGYFSTFLGDVNLDGVVNAADIAALADIIIGNPPAVYSREAADLNGDNNVSIQDLTRLIRMLLP